MELREIRRIDSTNIYNVGALIQWHTYQMQIEAAKTARQRDLIRAKRPLAERPLPDWDIVRGACRTFVTNRIGTRMVGIITDGDRKVVIMNLPHAYAVTNGQRIACYAMKRADIDDGTLYDFGFPITNRVGRAGGN
jgi:hypothetical protein